MRIHDDPLVYVYDAPGVMMPYLGRGDDGVEKGLKLALTCELLNLSLKGVMHGYDWSFAWPLSVSYVSSVEAGLM